MDFVKKFQNFFYNLLIKKGLNQLNESFVPFKYTDGWSELYKNVLLIGISFCIIMMIASPMGFLYVTFVRPIFLNFMLLMRVPVPDYYFPTPESGMHYMTIFIYFICAFISFRYMEKWGIPAIQRIIVNVTIMFLSFYVPFEWVYITFADIFHNIPLSGFPVIWFYGWWKLDGTIIGVIKFALSSIVGVDGFVTIGGIYVLNYIKNDLEEFNFPVEYKFDKTSKLLLTGFIITMIAWVLIPLHSPDVYEHGTKWFPQTIYVVHGYYADYDFPDIDNDNIYGIVDEIWIPNDMIKWHNHISKAFSVAFMFYTFTPRKKDLKSKYVLDTP